ncbi:MAG TPA: hemerythrin domain-containing protein [Kofleriaceae bacterium]
MRARAKAQPTVFDQFHRSLVEVHDTLRASAGEISVVINDDTKDRATRSAVASFTANLVNHHKSEDSFFFPAFRAAGRMRSSDIEFLARKDEEHVAIHRLCVELRDLNTRSSRDATAWRKMVASHVSELSTLAPPHFAEEEATLTADHVATLLTASELTAVYRDMGVNWNRR